MNHLFFYISTIKDAIRMVTWIYTSTTYSNEIMGSSTLHIKKMEIITALLLKVSKNLID